MGKARANANSRKPRTIPRLRVRRARLNQARIEIAMQRAPPAQRPCAAVKPAMAHISTETATALVVSLIAAESAAHIFIHHFIE
jgi:hypothetical protein